LPSFGASPDGAGIRSAIRIRDIMEHYRIPMRSPKPRKIPA
jgi:hypothetical protein